MCQQRWVTGQHMGWAFGFIVTMETMQVCSSERRWGHCGLAYWDFNMNIGILAPSPFSFFSSQLLSFLHCVPPVIMFCLLTCIGVMETYRHTLKPGDSFAPHPLPKFSHLRRFYWVLPHGSRKLTNLGNHKCQVSYYSPDTM